MSTGVTFSVVTATVTKVLSRTNDAKAVWFQHASTTADFYVYAQQSGAAPAFTTSEFKLPRAGGSGADAYLVLDNQPLANWDWYVYQASGGDVAIRAGRWDAPNTESGPRLQ